MRLSKTEWYGVAIMMIAASIIFVGMSRLVKLGLEQIQQRELSGYQTLEPTWTETDTDTSLD